MKLEDVSVLVTGGASGLGLATVQAMAEAGAHVVIADLPSSKGEDVAAELGGRVRFSPVDVTDETGVLKALDAAESMGPLRVAVNCAGTGSGAMVVGDDGNPMPLADFTRMIDIDLVGTFNVIRLAAARMAKLDVVGEERGVIVNTSSIAGFEADPGQSAYAAAKAGINGMTLPLAREFAPLKIRCVTVAPGLFKTPLIATDTTTTDALAKIIPMPPRAGNPEEFAALVAHVIGNVMFNGTVIRLDGACRM